MRKRILNEPVDVISFEEASFRIKAALFRDRGFKIVTLNPEMIVEAKENFEFQAAINNANLIIPDGTGIVWALKRKYKDEKIERIPGIELAKKTLELANELNKKVSLFGGTKEVLDDVIAELKNVYPNIEFVSSTHGFNGKEKDKKIAEDLSKDNPSVVLVALGSPRQELWINKYSSYFPNSIMIGVGGSFDIWSGKKKRAPGWMIDMNLEWLYRITKEPHRIPRVLKSHPKFIKMVLKEDNNLQLHAK